MAPTAQSHQRSHSLLLLQKLLNLRDGASPLTLVLDTLEQSAGHLLREFATRAKVCNSCFHQYTLLQDAFHVTHRPELRIQCLGPALQVDLIRLNIFNSITPHQIGRTKVVFVSLVTAKQPSHADVFVRGRNKPLKTLASDIASHCPSPTGAVGKDGMFERVLIIIDSLNPLAASHPRLLFAFFSSIVSPVASVVAVYHTDVPLILDKSFEYEPHPLTVLGHLATAIFRVSSLWQEIESRRAQNRSQQEPGWGLREGREGVLVGVKPSEHDVGSEGIVLEMEKRRRSGRVVVGKFVLHQRHSDAGIGTVTLLSDHPAFATPPDPRQGGTDGASEDGEDMETTFNLGLTDKQRKDREGVVLPYFDAQTDIGAGEGGRILYEMGREDDFDDEEDEI